MSLATKKLYVSRDVTFHETIFPFTLSADPTSFPSSPIQSPFFVDPISYSSSNSPVHVTQILQCLHLPILSSTLPQLLNLPCFHLHN